jgi:hypothetical protein
VFADASGTSISGGFTTVKFGDDADVPRPYRDESWTVKALELATPYDASAAALQEERHIHPVAMAFEYYRRARLITLDLKQRKASDPVRGRLETVRARLIYFGDLIITSVEQDLVDPGVNRVLDEVPSAASDYASMRLAHFAELSQGVPRQLAELRLAVKFEPAKNFFKEMWVRALTRELLVLALPAETLHLGRDVPPPAAAMPYYPPELRDFGTLPMTQSGTRKISASIAGYTEAQQDADNVRLRQTVTAFDRSNGSGRGTGARDWRRVVERINWATTMIRTRIQDPSLFWPPFRNEDVERIYRGKLPLHPGNPTDFDVLGPLESFPYLSGGGTVPFCKGAGR